MQDVVTIVSYRRKTATAQLAMFVCAEIAYAIAFAAVCATVNSDSSVQVSEFDERFGVKPG